MGKDSISGTGESNDQSTRESREKPEGELRPINHGPRSVGNDSMYQRGRGVQTPQKEKSTTPEPDPERMSRNEQAAAKNSGEPETVGPVPSENAQRGSQKAQMTTTSDGSAKSTAAEQAQAVGLTTYANNLSVAVNRFTDALSSLFSQ